MAKLIKKCPFCFDPVFNTGRNIKLVKEENQYRVVCQDCGASIVFPRTRHSNKSRKENDKD